MIFYIKMRAVLGVIYATTMRSFKPRELSLDLCIAYGFNEFFKIDMLVHQMMVFVLDLRHYRIKVFEILILQHPLHSIHPVLIFYDTHSLKC